MRHRAADCILQAIENNYARGVRTYFFTDDNLSRSPVWEQVFDGLIAMREERGMQVQFIMQVDTQAYKLPNFVEKARRAGCNMVFIGLETLNPKNIEAANKLQNRVDKFDEMMQAWRDARIMTHVGYIIGFPHDTPESVKREVMILRDQLKVDQASFFMLTPLPGSEDHRAMMEARTPLDADLNNFDSSHATYRHPNFTGDGWLQAYQDAFADFFSKEHITEVLLRTPPERFKKMMITFIWCRYAVLAGVHPMMAGLIRLKERTTRRPCFQTEGRLRYAWRRARDLAWTARTYARIFWEFQEIWLLTRKPEDPRWAAVADLHGRWALARKRIREFDLAGRRDAAVEELRAVLAASVEHIHQLKRAPGVRSRTRRRLNHLVSEAEGWRQALESHVPTMAQIQAAEQFVAHGLLARYEELAIRYVATRRRLNAYRQELAERFRSGDIWSPRMLVLPRLIALETWLAVRFGWAFFLRTA
jgi:hypothetical protein